jgi:membrane peptidoglycan carboxypeptidase
MPTVPQIVGYRERYRNRTRNQFARRIALPAGAFLSLAVAIVVLAFSFFYVNLVQGLPSLAAIPALIEPPDGLYLQPTRLYDRSGQNIILVLENPAAGERRYLYYPYPSKNINDTTETAAGNNGRITLPRSLILTTIGGRDPGLWKHAGFSLNGVLTGSHPTIAQQLAADLLLLEEPPGVSRNIRERLIAAQITAHYGREKVLEWYLNSLQYGHQIYGVDAAARVFFGKPAERLTLAEAAVLTALAETPSINPLSFPDAAHSRQQEILKNMAVLGLITEEEARNALKENIVFQYPYETDTELASSFTQLVIEQAAKQINLAQLERGGMKIITTLDYDLQIQTLCAIEHQIAIMQDKQEPNQHSWNDLDCQSARLLPAQSFSALLSSLELSGSGLVLDQKTGQILAMTSKPAQGIDPLRQAGKPPGSLITPFIYLTAFTRGFSPGSLVWDIPESLPGEITIEQEKYAGPVRIRAAFANDYLIPSIHVLEKVGADSVWSILQQLGVTSLTQTAINGYLTELPLLSGGEITLLEIGRAFGVLGNQGLFAGITDPSNQDLQVIQPVLPVTVLKISDVRGKVWIDCTKTKINCSHQVRPVVSPELSYLVTEMMSDETARWPTLGHPNPLEIGRPSAVKMGLTGSPGSAWTAGYTPHLTVAIWMGDVSRNHIDLPWSSQEDQLLASGTAGIWHAVMQYASLDHPPEGWNSPHGVLQIEVCDPSGLLPTVHCPSPVRELFLSGNEPKHYDTLYRAYTINRETGRLATVYTPAWLVEEKVFFVIPPEGAGWKEWSGIEGPPDVYDVITLPPITNPEANIVSPEPFSSVAGKVSIHGSAAGEKFSYYRLQIGKGLNPGEWIQLIEDSTKPVKQGVLGEWDTAVESGLYVLQLLVVDKDQRVEVATVQVTVDNTPPTIDIIQPADGQIIKSGPRASVVIQAQASDNVALSTVEFFADGIRLAAFHEPPFILSWKPQSGEYTLVVRAADKAGNQSEETVDIIVE